MNPFLGTVPTTREHGFSWVRGAQSLVRLRCRMWRPGPTGVGREPTPPACAFLWCADVESLRIRLRPPRRSSVTREALPGSCPSGHEAAQAYKTDPSTQTGCVRFAKLGVPSRDAKRHTVAPAANTRRIRTRAAAEEDFGRRRAAFCRPLGRAGCRCGTVELSPLWRVQVVLNRAPLVCEHGQLATCIVVHGGQVGFVPRNARGFSSERIREPRTTGARCRATQFDGLLGFSLGATIGAAFLAHPAYRDARRKEGHKPTKTSGVCSAPGNALGCVHRTATPAGRPANARGERPEARRVRELGRVAFPRSSRVRFPLP